MLIPIALGVSFSLLKAAFRKRPAQAETETFLGHEISKKTGILLKLPGAPGEPWTIANEKTDVPNDVDPTATNDAQMENAQKENGGDVMNDFIKKLVGSVLKSVASNPANAAIIAKYIDDLIMAEVDRLLASAASDPNPNPIAAAVAALLKDAQVRAEIQQIVQAELVKLLPLIAERIGQP